jgi:lysophospholipase L1-like esterase
MLSTWPCPDGAKVLGVGDSTLAPAFTHQLVAPLFAKIRASRNPITAPAPVGGGLLPSGGYRTFSFINKGVSGDEIENIVDDLPGFITAYQPTHHLFAAGINDVQNGVALATSEAEFDTYLDLTAGTGKPTLCLLPFYWVGLGATVVTFNAAMTAVATAHASAANIMVVNQYTVLNAATNSTLYTAPDTDEAHPNAAWRAALCSYLYPLVST